MARITIPITLPFRSALVAAAAALATSAHAQSSTTLTPVTVTGRADAAVGVAGWGDVPLSRAPFQATVTTSEQMRDAGVQRMSDIVRLDPGVADAYNAEGYWDSFTVRGYVIDNRFNYRRDGLPINAETSIALDNKERIEVLKGTSGLQAGTSAPGGLVNLVVKRPTDAPLREALLAWRQDGSLLGAVDLGQRFGVGKAFGLRLNATAEHLDPRVRDARGHRALLALAGDWRVAPDTLIEAEFETSRRNQPSVPGFSLLGAAVPDPHRIDPGINLNNQPWSLPVVFDADTASLRVTQRLSADWRFTAHAATQRLRTDDRIAFPFGCSAEGNFDRYCSDGSFDLYDFRSENERRRTDALELGLHGALRSGDVTHTLSAGVLRSRFRARFQRFANNWVGTGNIEGTAVTPPDPTLAFDNTDRDEDSTELFARDAIRFPGGTAAWLGLRHTRLQRSSVDTSGNPGPHYPQSLTTPWLALSHEFGAGQLVYASWGEGMESAVTPNRPAYGDAAGRPLPALKSRQVELGIKGRSERAAWNVALFDIDRPVATDTGTAFFIDGSARHRGIEAGGSVQSGPWMVAGGLQWLRARREGSQDASLDGKRPINVPRATLKLQARYAAPTVPGLALQTDLLAEGDRMALPDNSARISGYARLDALARYELATGAGTLIWRVGVDNVFDRRAWKESPFQFGHVYLFPLPPRTWRASLELAL